MQLDEARLAGFAALAKGWRAYAETECNVVGQMTGGTSHARDIYALICEQRRYAARTALVRAAIGCAEAALQRENNGAAQACLEKLTPLRSESDYLA